MPQAKVKEIYKWQEPQSGSDQSYQIIHLLIAAIFGLLIGGYIASQAPSYFISQS